MLLLNSHPPFSRCGMDSEHDVPLGLGSSRNIAHATRIIENEFEYFAAVHSFEPHLSVRPVQGTFNAEEIQSDRHLTELFCGSIRELGHIASNNLAHHIFTLRPDQRIFADKECRHSINIAAMGDHRIVL